jgi:hypothetical protein
MIGSGGAQNEYFQMLSPPPSFLGCSSFIRSGSARFSDTKRTNPMSQSGDWGGVRDKDKLWGRKAKRNIRHDICK